jgi:hypothetical protein
MLLMAGHVVSDKVRVGQLEQLGCTCCLSTHSPRRRIIPVLVLQATSWVTMSRSSGVRWDACTESASNQFETSNMLLERTSRMERGAHLCRDCQPWRNGQADSAHFRQVGPLATQLHPCTRE